MEKYKKLVEEIENVSNNEVVKKSCISGVGVAFLLAGVGAALAGNAFEDPNSSLPTFFFTTAAVLLLTGILKLAISRKCYFFQPAKSKIQSETFYFDAQDGVELQNSLENSRFDQLKRLNKKRDGVIKMDVMMAKNGQFVALQVSEYIPYAYETVTPVRCYRGEPAQQLFAYIKS